MVQTGLPEAAHASQEQEEDLITNAKARDFVALAYYSPTGEFDMIYGEKPVLADPDSFLASIDRPTPFTVEDFTLEKFQAVFWETLERREELQSSTARRLDSLIAKLDQNEELIRAIMER